MEEKLTLKRTFELCKELWSWLEKNPNMSKSMWPGWFKYVDVDCKCFACEYVFQKNKTCEECPLKKLWIYGCQSTIDSPYRLWDCSSDKKERKKNAKIIIDFCDKELKKIIKKENNK